MGTQKRIRYFEYIFAAALILFSIRELFMLLDCITVSTSHILACASGLVTGIIILLRKYDSVILKTAFVITAAFAVYTSKGWSMIKIFFNENYSGWYKTTDYLAAIGFSVLLPIAAIVALMTMNNSITWECRGNLLKYTYIMAGLHLLFSFNGLCTVNLIFFVYLMIPCLVKTEVNYNSILGLTGEISFSLFLIISFLCSMFSSVRNLRLLFDTFSLDCFIHVSEPGLLTSMLRIVCIIALMLSPLMAFEREFSSRNNAEEKVAVETEVPDDDNN